MATTMISPVEAANSQYGGGVGNSKRALFTRAVAPGCKILDTIEEKGITAIAGHAGLTRNYVSMVLNGVRKPSFDAILTISRACRCNPGQLIEYLNRQYRARRLKVS